jgi:dipeptidyl aminopeptidase/acylaminoacyl peptidase
MVYRLRAPVSAIFLFFATVVAGPAQAAPPAEAFGRLPAIDDVEVSPDGRRVAMLQSLQGRTVAAIYTLNAPAGTPPVIVNPDEGKVRSVLWANNDRLLVWMSITYKVPGSRQNPTYEMSRVLSMKADGSDSKFLFRDKQFSFVINPPSLLSTLPNDPDHVLMVQLDMQYYDYADGRQAGSKLSRGAFRGVSVYKVNVTDGREKRVETGWKTTDGWRVDSNATVRLRIDGNGKTIIHARGPEGGEFKEIARYDDNDPQTAMAISGFGTDPDKIYVAARRNSDRLGAYSYDLTAAKITDAIYLHDRFDVGGLVKDRYTNRVVGAWYTDHMTEFAYWDQAYAAIQKRLEGVFKGQSVTIVSMSRDRNTVAILVQPPGQPGTFYLYEANSKRVSPLGNRYPELAPETAGKKTPLSYNARDGLAIPAYLTLPPGKEAKNLPLVVLPHGGPEGRDDLSFDWWSGFYASRGYAVLQPNFRGSDGYGMKFVRAGYGEFGGKMQDDLTDGVKHLISQGIADPKRVCIVGASYGGYAALAGAAFTPDVYRCAVSVAGVSDLVVMIGEAVRSGASEVGPKSVNYWQKWLGDRHTDTGRMEAASPARHAEKVQVPIMLIHGRDDTVVPYLHSELMAKALQKAGKPHRLIEMKGEDHWLSQADSRILILKETEAFLKEHIGG